MENIDLTQNEMITENAAHVVLKAAVDNGICQEVAINKINRTKSTEIKKLVDTLLLRKQQVYSVHVHGESFYISSLCIH